MFLLTNRVLNCFAVMGCVQSQAFCTKPPKSTNPSSDAGSLRAQSLDELSSIGVPEIPSRLHNLCHSRDYQCAWKPEMGPMKAWMDISIDDELQPRIVIDLVPELSPQACENFRVLCRAKVGHGYKKTFFHDIEQDMNASGGRFGGVSIFGERFKDEICREQPKYERYNVFMANEGPNTNNTEFFFALGENEFRKSRQRQGQMRRPTVHVLVRRNTD